MKEKTVRELGGEIWAEIMQIQNSTKSSSPLKNINMNATHELIDLVMGVLARHIGNTITNDLDLPVTPLKLS